MLREAPSPAFRALLIDELNENRQARLTVEFGNTTQAVVRQPSDWTKHDLQRWEAWLQALGFQSRVARGRIVYRLVRTKARAIFAQLHECERVPVRYTRRKN